MLYIFLSSLLIFPTLLGFGSLFQKLVGRVWEGLSGRLVLGFFLVTILWHILAFFIPLSIEIELVTLFFGFFLFFRFKVYKEFSKIGQKEWALWACLSGVTFLVSSGYPFIMDHFGYYVPTIKWLTEYGLVKGISNWDWVLGQMSPWHIFQAGFSHFSDRFFRINALLMAVFYFYIIEKKSWEMLVFSPILFFFLNAPSPDLPAIVFSLMILNEILKKNQQFMGLFGLSVWVFTIKPTMIWLPILSFLYPVVFFSKNLKFSILGLFVGFLYLAKNIWVFGYPFFPMNIFDLEIPWKPYSGLFTVSSEIAVQKTFDMQYSLAEIHQFSFFESCKNWLLLPGIKGVINSLFVASLLGLVVFTWVRKEKLLSLILFSILVKSALVLGFSAQYRFFIDVFFVVFIVVFGQFFTYKKAIFSFVVFSSLVITFLSFPQTFQGKIPSFQLENFMRNAELKQFYKPLNYASQPFEKHKVGSLEFNVPDDYAFNYDVPLPSLTVYQLLRYDELGIFPQKIDKSSLKNGFTWKKMNSAEKQQLKQVLEKLKR